MAKYIDADRLRAEIEKLEGLEYPCDNSEQNVGFGNALDRVSDIIESLQQEQPEVDLDKEIDACWQNWLSPSNQKEVEGVLPKTEFAMYANHFFELGQKDAANKYDEIEYNRQRAQEQLEVDLEKVSRNVYESWMGGTMNDVRRDMVELGKVLNARKEESK